MTSLRLPMALSLAVLCVAATAATAHAQSQPQPSLPGLGPFFENPAAWVTDVFNKALLAIGQKTTGDVSGVVATLIGSLNVISETPPNLSYNSVVVKTLHDSLRTAANAGLGVVTAWTAFNLIVHPHIRAPYHAALQIVPRVLVGALLVNTSLGWGSVAIDLNNALCQVLGKATLPGWDVVVNGAPALLMNIIGVVAYLLMGMLLLGQMVMRLALIDVLLVVSPIALLCWVVPQTYGWARLWFSTFFGTVFVQFLQVAVLQLGSDLIGNLVSMVPSVIANPIEGSGHWFTSLLLGLSVLQLARRIPRLMPGFDAGAGAVPNLGALAARNVVSLFSQQRSENRAGRRR